MDNSKHDKITPTADLISYFRIFSDTPYVKEIAEMTNAEKTAKEIMGETFPQSSFLAVMSESRYKKIDICVKKYKNILEVAVGRSPRGLIFTENPEINYVVTDLPLSLEQHKSIINNLMTKYNIKRPRLHFIPANALNLKDLKRAVKILPKGEIAIISEGFIVYLPREEKKIFLKNVHKILVGRGGVLITSDIMVLNRQQNRSPEIHSNIAESTGRDMRDNNFNDMDDASKFIKEAGFDFEIFNPQLDLVSMKTLNLENDERSKRVKDFPVWILKVKSE